MSDPTAAFFANKKKKKKAFKGFNANLVDVASVTQTVHVCVSKIDLLLSCYDINVAKAFSSYASCVPLAYFC
jgi:hypothetical protein